MLPFDWTNLKRPRFHEGRYYWKYLSSVVLTDISDQEKRQATAIGLTELVSFYGKESDISSAMISDSLDNSEMVIEPRPKCDTLEILVSISEENLEFLEDKDYDLDNLVVVNLITEELERYISNIAMSVQRHSVYSRMWGKYLHVDDFAVSLSDKARLFQKVMSELEQRALLNDEILSIDSSSSIQLLYNSDQRFVGAVLNQTPLRRGASHENNITSALNDRLISSIMSKLPDTGEVAIQFNRSREKEEWQDYYRQYITYGEVTFQEIPQEKGFLRRMGEDIFDRSGLPDYWESREAKTQREIDRFKEIPEQFLGNQCGPITLDELRNDIDRISKTQSQKEAEDILLDNSTFKAQIHQRNRNRIDYVGDVLFDDFPGQFPGGPSSIEEVFSNALNYISIDLLIKKTMQCILQQGELPDLWKLCIDVYVPFSLTLPDNLKIPDIFGFLSDLIVKALLFALQQALFLIIDMIMDALEKCARGELIDVGTSEALSNLGEFDAAAAFLAEKVYDNLDNIGDAQNLQEDEFSDTGSLLEDLRAALTPQEFCALLSGTASDEVYKLVLCIIETKYPNMALKLDTIEKVKSLFASLGSLVSLDECEIDRTIPVPTNPTLCITKEQIQIRESLLAAKGISKDVLNEQLEQAEQRRQNTLNQLENLLRSDTPLGDEVFGDKDKEEFLINLSPCTRDNRPARHMIELSTDSVIDSLSLYFNQAILEDTGLSSVVTDEFKQDYRAQIRSPSFSRIEDGNLVMSSGPTRVEHSFSGLGFTQDLLVSGLELSKTDDVPSRISHQSQNSRINALQTLNQSLTENDYEVMLSRLTEFITSIVSDSLVFGATEEELLETFNNIVSDSTARSDLYENCWEGGINIRDGINESYFDRECETRDTTLYTQATLAGLIRLYVRSIMIEYFIKNLFLITQFSSADLLGTFVNEFIRLKVAPVISAIPKTEFIEDIDEVLNEELAIVSQEFEAIFQEYVNDNILPNNNIKNYFIDSLTLFQDDPRNFVNNRFYLLSESNFDIDTNELSVSAELKYVKRLGVNPEFETLISVTRKVKDVVTFSTEDVDEVVEDLLDSLKESDDLDFFLNFVIPTKDILSMLSLFNITRIRNNVLEQLLTVNETIITNLENSDDFTFRNRNFERRNKISQVNSLKNNDRKKNLEKLID